MGKNFYDVAIHRHQRITIQVQAVSRADAAMKAGLELAANGEFLWDGATLIKQGLVSATVVDPTTDVPGPITDLTDAEVEEILETSDTKQPRRR